MEHLSIEDTDREQQSLDTDQRKGRARNAGWQGILFVVLLFLSAGMVTLPSSAGDLEEIASFYAANRSIILIAQVIGLIAIPMFIAFAFGIENIKGGRHPFRRIGIIGFAGILVGIVSVATAIPVIVLALTTVGLSFWVHMTDLSDAALFLSIGAFCIVVSIRGEALPGWLRAVSALVGLVALARGGMGFAGITSVLNLAAPLVFLAFVLLASSHLLLVYRRKTT